MGTIEEVGKLCLFIASERRLQRELITSSPAAQSLATERKAEKTNPQITQISFKDTSV
jgi:hypothetical protein